MSKMLRHYEESVFVPASPQDIFSYADNFHNFSSHMNKSSWMMGGGKMETKTDDGKGQRIGSHVRMGGKVFGVSLSLDEAITIHEPPIYKEWQTVEKINLLVIDHYKLGFKIKAEKDGSKMTVFIDYNLPQSAKTWLLGLFLGDMYAKWCVQQMINGVKNHFVKGGGNVESKIYTCPMHPEVQQDKPGNCPKCGMTLVEKK